MIPVFREYLALTNQLPLVGVGTIRVRNIAAQLDIAARVIASPRQEFYFEQSDQVDAQDFLNWLSSRDNLPVSVVHEQYAIVINHLNSQKVECDDLTWKGIGGWKRDADNTLRFTASNEPYTIAVPVRAEKVIRENTSHTVQVGEASIDSITMAKNLQQQKAKFTLKSGWGFLLFVAVIALSAWAMLTNKFTPAMLSNPAKVVPTETTPTYKVW